MTIVSKKLNSSHFLLIHVERYHHLSDLCWTHLPVGQQGVGIYLMGISDDYGQALFFN